MVMKRKKVRLKYKKERVLFSDVLPYELPFIFTNRYFYRFLVKNQIRIVDEKIIWGEHVSKGVLAILAFLLNTSVEKLQDEKAYILKGNNINNMKRIPFAYRILHKPNKYRELYVINPINQIQIVDFYEKYRSLILYYSNIDRFSLRHPSKVACYFYYCDRLHHTLLGRKTDNLELFFNEYENLKTYFSYKRYNQIFRFYEDYRYQRAEKKFEHLLKFDIQSCFDSIYTHSIAWATGGGKDLYKTNFCGSDSSFATKWDKLMQLMNYNETNGIVIGPEFSRIFAELILQHIDLRVETDLKSMGFKANRDYECYRYVDDFFFYYNNDSVKEKAMILFSNKLREFKLSISSEKTIAYDRPFVTDITKAKIQIDELIDKYIKFHQDENPALEVEEDKDSDYEKDTTFKFLDNQRIKDALSSKCYLYLNSTDFNTRFKTTINSCSVDSKNVVNYTLARINRKLVTVLNKYDRNFKILSEALKEEKFASLHKACIECKIKKEQMLTSFLLSLLDSVFFLYSSNKRVNTTLKVISILNDIIIMLNNDYVIKKENVKRFSDNIRDSVFKKIQEEISLVFQISDLDENTQLETLYFLIILKRLRSKYHLSESELQKYLKVEKDKEYPKFNALSILILLYYFGNENQYKGMKNKLMLSVINKYQNVPEATRLITTELTILTLDLLTCPYIEKYYKKEICKLMSIPLDSMQEMKRYFKKNHFMFTKWVELDITKELNAKISQEVYS
jgi:hypothetical protein